MFFIVVYLLKYCKTLGCFPMALFLQKFGENVFYNGLIVLTYCFFAHNFNLPANVLVYSLETLSIPLIFLRWFTRVVNIELFFTVSVILPLNNPSELSKLILLISTPIFFEISRVTSLTNPMLSIPVKLITALKSC